MELIVGEVALAAIAAQDATEKQTLDTKATNALDTANNVASQFTTVKAEVEAATATANNAYTTAQVANAEANNAHTLAISNQQAITAEAGARVQGDNALQGQITDIVNGTTVVGKATSDGNGNNIVNTYATKASLATVATSGDYDDLINKPTAGTNIEISAQNVISAPNAAVKTEAVGSFLLTIDPQTFVISLQAKDVNGTNIGTAQTVDLPIETMVVSGSYDDTTQSITLTLQNGQTITFSVAALVAGLQTQLTFDSTPTQSSTNPVTSGGVYDALQLKQGTLTFDSTPTQNSNNPVTSDGVYTALTNKQDTLTFDSTPTQNSTNPVTSGGVYDALQQQGGTITGVVRAIDAWPADVKTTDIYYIRSYITGAPLQHYLTDTVFTTYDKVVKAVGSFGADIFDTDNTKIEGYQYTVTTTIYNTLSVTSSTHMIIVYDGVLYATTKTGTARNLYELIIDRDTGTWFAGDDSLDTIQYSADYEILAAQIVKNNTISYTDITTQIVNNLKKRSIDTISNNGYSITINMQYTNSTYNDFIFKEFSQVSSGTYTITNTGAPVHVKVYGARGNDSKNSNCPKFATLSTNGTMTFEIANDDPYTDLNTFAVEAFFASV